MVVDAERLIFIQQWRDRVFLCRFKSYSIVLTLTFNPSSIMHIVMPSYVTFCIKCDGQLDEPDDTNLLRALCSHRLCLCHTVALQGRRSCKKLKNKRLKCQIYFPTIKAFAKLHQLLAVKLTPSAGCKLKLQQRGISIAAEYYQQHWD